MRRIPPNRPAGQRGALLIEALVVILIFSFGLLGMISLQARATKMSVSTEDSNRAALLANELVAQVWAAQSLNVNTTAWLTRVQGRGPDGQVLPGANGTVTPVTVGGIPGLNITVTWRPVAADHDSQYVTYAFLNPSP